MMDTLYTHGRMVIEYNNMQIPRYRLTKRFLHNAHLMMNLKLDEGRMWKRSDG